MRVLCLMESEKRKTVYDAKLAQIRLLNDVNILIIIFFLFSFSFAGHRARENLDILKDPVRYGMSNRRFPWRSVKRIIIEQFFSLLFIFTSVNISMLHLADLLLRPSDLLLVPFGFTFFSPPFLFLPFFPFPAIIEQTILSSWSWYGIKLHRTVQPSNNLVYKLYNVYNNI